MKTLKLEIGQRVKVIGWTVSVSTGRIQSIVDGSYYIKWDGGEEGFGWSDSDVKAI